MIKNKKLTIIAAGSFYTPQDTPAHSKGWWGSIAFLKTNKYIPPIEKRFDTKDEADAFVRKTLFHLWHDNICTRLDNEEQRQIARLSKRTDY